MADDKALAELVKEMRHWGKGGQHAHVATSRIDSWADELESLIQHPAEQPEEGAGSQVSGVGKLSGPHWSRAVQMAESGDPAAICLLDLKQAIEVLQKEAIRKYDPA